jgi:hypothetical protein
MIPLFSALALFLVQEPAATAAPLVPAAETPAATAPRIPEGAPTEPYQFVSWCYGILRGYLDMHDAMMPEVTRIETEFRNPRTRLVDDLKVYQDQQRQGRKDLALFQRAITAAEKASLRPITPLGAAAVRKGRSYWNDASGAPKAQRAQSWMGWTLPAACQSEAAALEKRAVLMGAGLQVNADPVTAPPETPVETPAAQAQ